MAHIFFEKLERRHNTQSFFGNTTSGFLTPSAPNNTNSFFTKPLTSSLGTPSIQSFNSNPALALTRPFSVGTSSFGNQTPSWPTGNTNSIIQGGWSQNALPAVQAYNIGTGTSPANNLGQIWGMQGTNNTGSVGSAMTAGVSLGFPGNINAVSPPSMGAAGEAESFFDIGMPGATQPVSPDVIDPIGGAGMPTMAGAFTTGIPLGTVDQGTSMNLLNNPIGTMQPAPNTWTDPLDDIGIAANRGLFGSGIPLGTVDEGTANGLLDNSVGAIQPASVIDIGPDALSGGHQYQAQMAQTVNYTPDTVDVIDEGTANQLLDSSIGDIFRTK